MTTSAILANNCDGTHAVGTAIVAGQHFARKRIREIPWVAHGFFFLLILSFAI
jgi:hypothetical protein